MKARQKISNSFKEKNLVTFLDVSHVTAFRLYSRIVVFPVTSKRTIPSSITSIRSNLAITQNRLIHQFNKQGSSHHIPTDFLTHLLNNTVTFSEAPSNCFTHRNRHNHDPSSRNYIRSSTSDGCHKYCSPQSQQ